VARSLYHLTFSSDIKLFDNPAVIPLFSCREKLRRLLKQEGFCSGTVAVCYAVGGEDTKRNLKHVKHRASGLNLLVAAIIL